MDFTNPKDDSFHSSVSNEFQPVFMNITSKPTNINLEDKFKKLEKNVRLLMDNTSYIPHKSPLKHSIPPDDNNKELEKLIIVLKGIKKECEVIRLKEEKKNALFLQDYSEKLLLLESEVRRLEEVKNRKIRKNFKNESFQIFHIEGKGINDKPEQELGIKSLEKAKLKKNERNTEDNLFLRENKENKGKKIEKKDVKRKLGVLCNNKIL